MRAAVRSTQQNVEGLRDITNRLQQNLRSVIAHDALLRRINSRDDIIPSFNNTVAGHGFGVIQHGLIELLILALTRCYDPASRNRASLPHTLDLEQAPAAGDHCPASAPMTKEPGPDVMHAA